MNTIATSLVWALWIVSGGKVNSGNLSQPQVSAYFVTQEECQRVGELVNKLSDPGGQYKGGNTFQCIQARYVISK